MTNEQKVRVDRLERYLIANKINLYTTVRTDDLDTVLSLIKEQENQIEKDRKIKTKLCEEVDREYEESQNKSKIIDLMAEQIKIAKQKRKIRTFVIKPKVSVRYLSKEEVKQYFEDKVEKENKEI